MGQKTRHDNYIPSLKYCYIFCFLGVYTLTPKSCHRFDQESYKYNTYVQHIKHIKTIMHDFLGSLLTRNIIEVTEVELTNTD